MVTKRAICISMTIQQCAAEMTFYTIVSVEHSNCW